MLLGMAMCTGCSNFDDINTNPDASTKVKSSLIATGAISNMLKPSWGAGFVDPMFLPGYISWGEGTRGEMYNSFDRKDFGRYPWLKDYQTMAELAPEDMKEAYEGLALLLKSMVLYDLTVSLGDIPCTEILKGDEGLFTPKYDEQKVVFQTILNDLEAAYSKLSVANDFDGDVIWNGNARKWAKAVTAFQLRVLINLSKKETDPDLDVVNRFKRVYENGALMESNDDQLQLTFSDKENQNYPFYSAQNKHWEYPMLSDFFVNMLKKTEDYRLFYYAKPAQTQLDAGIEAGSWEAFAGVDFTAPIAEVKKHYSIKDVSGLNLRYSHYIQGEPYITLGYSEQNFILAEAALRGWISKDPSVFYKKAIQGNMEFIAQYTPDDADYHYGHPLTAEYISNFIEKPAVQLNGSFEKQLEMIMEQKYIACFMQMAYQPYFDYRRTGYPKIPINPETSMNFNAPDKIPVRWQYPTVEISYNNKNLEEALQRQYNGSDEVNKLMWILQ